jgi:signal peptidase II
MSTQAERSYRWLFWSLALIGLTIDQASKYSVFAWLDDGRRGEIHEVVSGVFQLEARFGPGGESDRRPEVNKGALWGLGSGYNGLFAAISLGAAAAIVVWSCRRRAAQEGLLCVALGLILAGTLGNFYDRVVYGGVRDFLHWKYLFDFPVFNFADCCLVLGAGLLLLQAFYGQPDPEDQPAQAQPAAEPPPPKEQVAELTQ